MPTYILQNLKEYGEKLEKYNLYLEKQEQEAIKAGKQQSGGGDNNSDKQEGGKTLFDYFSFSTVIAIIGGGLLLSAVRKTNGLSSDKNDSPPNPRGI
jgi:hypothetical protein